jgi:AGCS family alanine or glycine:cation symporter
LALVFVGAGLDSGILWGIADLTMGLMALINIPAIAILSPYAVRALSDYIRRLRKKSKEPFTARSIGISAPLDYWQ